MVMVRMRTIKERQLTDSPGAHSLMRELRAIARSHVRLFQLVENFGESDEPADRRLEPEGRPSRWFGAELREALTGKYAKQAERIYRRYIESS